MLIAIIIFFFLIIIFAINVRISILGKNETVLIYFKIGSISFRLPHLKAKLPKAKGMAIGVSLTKSIISHSVCDRIYIAKYSRGINPLFNSLYLIFSNQLLGILQNSFLFVNFNTINLIYDSSYENIDYYFEAHISIITFIWALFKGALNTWVK